MDIEDRRNRLLALEAKHAAGARCTVDGIVFRSQDRAQLLGITKPRDWLSDGAWHTVDHDLAQRALDALSAAERGQAVLLRKQYNAAFFGEST